MNVIETAKTATAALVRNKVRAFLTMLGVIIGVFSVVLLIALVKGLQNYITDQFNSLGSNLVFILPGKMTGGTAGGGFMSSKLKEKHIDLINNYAGEYIEAMTQAYQASANASYRSNDFYSNILGTNYQIFDIAHLELTSGRMFTKSEEMAKARVAVIGPQVASHLFTNRSPVGQRIKLDNESYLVIGVTESKGPDDDARITIPYTTMKDAFNLQSVSEILIKAKDTNDLQGTMKAIRLALMRDLKSDDFTVMSQEDILSSIQNILKMLQIGLGAIASISLLVGGIGIMNIMLVSVTERTKEIGLRKALGATSRNIGLQFLIESVMISVSGGIIGVVLGWLGSLVGRMYIRTEVPWWAVLLAFGFSMVVGVAFGTYPAASAAKKDPIEALRYE
jgi:putative ABC transport system permease protein